MIGKVKVTQEQANEIGGVKDIAYAIDVHSFNKRPDKAIAGLSTADLARALLIGYEVEPEPLKVGDWAKWLLGKECIGNIYEINGGYKAWAYWSTDEGEPNWIHIEQLEKCTPQEVKVEEERRKWAGIEEGDVLRGMKSGALAIFTRDFPGHQEVQVRVHDGMLQNWDKTSVELYAKKVGEPNAKAPYY